MSETDVPTTAPSDEPDFLVPHPGPDSGKTTQLVDEMNWRWWNERAALGEGGLFVAFDALREDEVEEALRFARMMYGEEEVLTGDPFDRERGRPVRSQPGVGIYVTPRGRAYAEERWLGRASQASGSGPDAS